MGNLRYIIVVFIQLLNVSLICQTEDTRNISGTLNGHAEIVPLEYPNSDTGTIHETPAWVIASIAVISSMALFLYVANHFISEHTNGKNLLYYYYYY
jgi:hypothetical protein